MKTSLLIPSNTRHYHSGDDLDFTIISKASYSFVRDRLYTIISDDRFPLPIIISFKKLRNRYVLTVNRKFGTFNFFKSLYVTLNPFHVPSFFSNVRLPFSSIAIPIIICWLILISFHDYAPLFLWSKLSFTALSFQ